MIQDYFHKLFKTGICIVFTFNWITAFKRKWKMLPRQLTEKNKLKF